MDKDGAEFLVVIVDVGSANARDVARAARGVVVARCCRVPASTDRYGVIKMGADVTRNHLHKQFGGYENVEIARPLQFASVETVRTAEELTKEAGDRRDYLDAIVGAFDHVVEVTGQKPVKSRAVLFTDAGGEVSEVNQMVDVLRGMQSRCFRLDVYVDGYTANGGRLEGLKNRQGFREDDVEMEVERLSQDAADRQFHRTTAYLRRLAEGSGGVVRSLEEALREFEATTPRIRRSAVKFNGTLDISAELRVPVRIYARTMVERLPTASKLSWPETVEDGQPVRAVVETIHSLQGEEIPRDELIKGHRYGPSIVPVSAVDEVALSFAAEKNLSVLSFVNRRSVPMFMLTGPVDVVIPHMQSEKAVKAFDSIVRAMRQLNRVAVARFVRRNEAHPVLVALWPHDEQQLPVLFSSRLPTAEDVRHYSMPGLDSVRSSLSPEETEAVRSYVEERTYRDWKDHRRMPHGLKGGDGDRRRLTPPWQVDNLLLRHLQNCIVSRAVHGIKAPLPTADDWGGSLQNAYEWPQMSNPAAPDGSSETGALHVFKDADIDALKPMKANKRRRAVYYATRGVQPGSVSLFLPDEDANVPREVGMANPEADFAAMLSCRSMDLFNPASESMAAVFERLIESSRYGDQFDKAIKCLEALREGCVSEREPGWYNDYLGRLVARAERDKPEHLLQFFRLFETNYVVAGALRLVQANEEDSSGTLYEETEAMRERISRVAKSAAVVRPEGRSPDAAAPKTHDGNNGDEADLGNLIDDIE